MEDTGFEPVAFSMPLRRATNCANPPAGVVGISYTQKRKAGQALFEISLEPTAETLIVVSCF